MSAKRLFTRNRLIFFSILSTIVPNLNQIIISLDGTLRRGEKTDRERTKWKKKEKLDITNKDKCVHITELKIGLMP